MNDNFKKRQHERKESEEKQKQIKQETNYRDKLIEKEGKNLKELRSMWENLQKMNARSTGMPDLDKKLVILFGKWGNAMEKFQKTEVIGTRVKNGQKNREKMDLLCKYYRHNYMYNEVNDTIQWVVSLSRNAPSYDEACWIVQEQDLKKLRIKKK